jgi:hypothetical protein
MCLRELCRWRETEEPLDEGSRQRWRALASERLRSMVVLLEHMGMISGRSCDGQSGRPSLPAVH